MHAERIDALLLRLLAREPGPWRVDELGREIGEPVAVADGVERLAAAGLLHRIEGGFVFLSAAGRHAQEAYEVAS